MKEDARRVAGYDWKKWEDGWATSIQDRADIVVWPVDGKFGCKVTIDRADGSGSVCFSLSPHPKRDLAMKHCVVWTESFLRNGPPGVQRFMCEVFSRWKTQCRTRADFFNHVFFSVTGGYEWFDGAVVSTSPEDRAQVVSEDVLPVGPMEDPLGPRPFSRVNELFSLICRVPQNAQPEWVALVHEAVQALAHRSSAGIDGAVRDLDDVKAQEENRKVGAQILRDIEKRFGLAVRSVDGSAQMGAFEGPTVN